MKSAKQILLDAADLLEKPGAWTQGKFARVTGGNSVGPCEPSACCWCAYGAVRKVASEGGASIVAAIQVLEAACGVHIPTFNDAPERTQAEVVAKLREAAELA